jgi:hypothetical protein
MHVIDTFIIESTVPIYDARKVDANFYEVLNNIDRLKRYKGEIPCGSCAVVTYTLNTWSRPPQVNVSFNIKWAMLLA